MRRGKLKLFWKIYIEKKRRKKRVRSIFRR